MPQLQKTLHSLSEWFTTHQRILPWRENPEPYRVWVSEIMLQQTQVQTVIPYFERFMKRYPTLHILASDSEEGVMSYWAGLGYYSRARNLLRTAQIIDRNGFFPRSRDELLNLPGIGPYTAGAILSIAFDQPEAILDGNVERVLSRLRRIGTNDKSVFKQRLWRLSETLVRSAEQNGLRPSVINQALMETGALICTPRNPDCTNCPLSATCRAYATGMSDQYPPRPPKRDWTQVNETVYCVINPQGRVLVNRNENGKWRAGMWDFPFSIPFIRMESLQPIGDIHTKHVVTHHKIQRTTRIMHTFIEPGDISGMNAKDWCWIGLNELTARAVGERPLAAGSSLVKTAREVAKYLKGKHGN